MGTIGDRLNNPMDLIGKKSVYVKRWERPCAVAFLISMQFKELVSLFNTGIFEYIKEDKTNKPTFTQIVTSRFENGVYKYGEK